jgi:hypothetical protein
VAQRTGTKKKESCSFLKKRTKKLLAQKTFSPKNF